MRNIFLGILLMGPFFLFSQIELGYCEGLTMESKTEKQVTKALKAINQKNLPMAKIYADNILEMDADNPHGLYLSGEVALKQKKIPVAVKFWEQLIDVCPNYLPEVQFFLGVIAIEDGKTEESISYLEAFLANAERDRYFDKEAKNIIKEAKLKQDFFANPVDFDPQVVSAVSTERDEYLAVISPDGELCFFTRKEKEVDRFSGPATKVRWAEKFSRATLNENGNFSVGEAMDYPFNQNYNEGGPSVTANNKEMYFTVCTVDKNGYKNCDIYFTFQEMGEWSSITPLGAHINKEDSWESQPSINADGTVLYFTSNRVGGFGGLDIYKIEKHEDGSWSMPENLGSEINTYKDEKSPFIHSDSQTLYFSSNGHPGLGGFDIYYSQNNNGWSIPENIGYPINTEQDEIGLFVSLDGETGYFNSNKLKGVGGWDLYSFEMPEKVRPKRVALIKGALLTEENKPDLSASLEVKNLKTKEIQKVKVDEETGEFATVVELKENQDLLVKVKKEGGAFSSKFISSDPKKKKEDRGVVKTELKATPIAVGKEYRLNDIEFPTNSYELTEQDILIIEEFKLFLDENPRVKADIQGHTDNIGNPQDNLALSKNRARVVYEYLVKLGVKKTRLSYHGYGATKPIADNGTEIGRSKNRRTVFVITGK